MGLRPVWIISKLGWNVALKGFIKYELIVHQTDRYIHGINRGIKAVYLSISLY